MRYVDDPYTAAQDADALLILNDRQEFAELDWQSCTTHSAIRS